jgi:hypothetical protein
MSQVKESNPKLSQSELELGQKWDRCLQDLLIKAGSGIGLGIVFSVVLFRSTLINAFYTIFIYRKIRKLSNKSCSKPNAVKEDMFSSDLIVDFIYFEVMTKTF